MHREINSHRTAVAFMAGEMAARGNPKGAEHVRELIEAQKEGEEHD